MKWITTLILNSVTAKCTGIEPTKLGPSDLTDAYFDQRINACDKIGYGAYSDVFKIQIEGKDYALKKYKKGYNWTKTKEEKFYKDVTSKNLSCIPKVYDTAATGYLLLDFIDGYVLGDYINEKKDDIQAMKTILGSVLRAITEFHAQGIIHANIHPKNILVEKETNKIYIVDMHDAYSGEGVYQDLTRFREHILKRFQNQLEVHHGEKIDLISGLEADNLWPSQHKSVLTVVREMYEDKQIRRFSRIVDYFLVPWAQYYAMYPLYWFTGIKRLSDKYLEVLKCKAGSDAVVKSSCNVKEPLIQENDTSEKAEDSVQNIPVAANPAAASSNNPSQEENSKTSCKVM